MNALGVIIIVSIFVCCGYVFFLLIRASMNLIARVSKRPVYQKPINDAPYTRRTSTGEQDKTLVTVANLVTLLKQQGYYGISGSYEQKSVVEDIVIAHMVDELAQQYPNDFIWRLIGSNMRLSVEQGNTYLVTNTHKILVNNDLVEGMAA